MPGAHVALADEVSAALDVRGLAFARAVIVDDTSNALSMYTQGEQTVITVNYILRPDVQARYMHRVNLECSNATNAMKIKVVCVDAVGPMWMRLLLGVLAFSIQGLRLLLVVLGCWLVAATILQQYPPLSS